MNNVSHKVVLKFPHKLVDQPIIYKLARDYNLVFNILKASVKPNEEGLLVLELEGEEKNYKEAIEYLKKLGVEVQLLSQDIKWNELVCIHCGACVGVCPTGALSVDRVTRRISFDDTKCIACELCIPACPVKAIEICF